MSGVIYTLASAPLTAQGEVMESTRDVFKAIGVGLFLDGLIVKWFGFVRAGVFTAGDSWGGGILDMSLGLFFLRGV